MHSASTAPRGRGTSRAPSIRGSAACTYGLAACTSAGAAAAVAPAANVHEGAAFRVGYLMALRCFARSSVVPAAVPVHGLGGGGNGR